MVASNSADRSLFADSYERLWWVKRIARRLAEVVDPIDYQGKHGPYLWDRGEDLSGTTHARIVFADPLVIPKEFGFLVADLAVNARSCLDMAIQEIVNREQIDWSRPQYPIYYHLSDQKTIDRLRKSEFRKFPTAVYNCVLQQQPIHQTPWGRFEPPANHELLMIQEVANANKHRNITPVVSEPTTTSYLFEGYLHLIDSVPRSQSYWSDGKTLLEVKMPTEVATDEILMNARLYTTVELMIKDSGYWMANPYDTDGKVIDVSVDTPPDRKVLFDVRASELYSVVWVTP